MTKNWVGQVVSSLGCIYNKKINRVWHRILLVKSCYSSNNHFEYCWFFWCDFWSQTGLILPDQNVLIPSDQNVLILLVSNMYDGIIVCYSLVQKIMHKARHNSKFCWLSIADFSSVIFWTKTVSTTYILRSIHADKKIFYGKRLKEASWNVSIIIMTYGVINTWHW